MVFREAALAESSSPALRLNLLMIAYGWPPYRLASWSAQWAGKQGGTAEIVTTVLRPLE